MSRTWTAIPVAIAHGTLDPGDPGDFGREARRVMVEAGADVPTTRRSLPHTIDPAIIPDLQSFVAAVLEAK